MYWVLISRVVLQVRENTPQSGQASLLSELFSRGVHRPFIPGDFSIRRNLAKLLIQSVPLCCPPSVESENPGIFPIFPQLAHAHSYPYPESAGYLLHQLELLEQGLMSTNLGSPNRRNALFFPAVVNREGSSARTGVMDWNDCLGSGQRPARQCLASSRALPLMPGSIPAISLREPMPLKLHQLGRKIRTRVKTYSLPEASASSSAAFFCASKACSAFSIRESNVPMPKG